MTVSARDDAIDCTFACMLAVKAEQRPASPCESRKAAAACGVEGKVSFPLPTVQPEASERNVNDVAAAKTPRPSPRIVRSMACRAARGRRRGWARHRPVLARVALRFFFGDVFFSWRRLQGETAGRGLHGEDSFFFPRHGARARSCRLKMLNLNVSLLLF